jgi:hypothetical protein
MLLLSFYLVACFTDVTFSSIIEFRLNLVTDSILWRGSSPKGFVNINFSNFA